MPKISQQKIQKISEQILHYLFSTSPSAQFTNKIAQEIARDEEFTKSILSDLKKKNLVSEINKNSLGLDYKRRQRWTLTKEAYEIYSKLNKFN